MDGKTASKIVNGTGITNLAVDYKNERIYWVRFNTIESSNYEGQNRVTITEDSKPILSLSVLNNRIFWVTSPFKVEPNSIIWTCDVTGTENCSNC